MNEENDWDQTTEVDVVEGPVEKVTRVEIVKALKDMKTGKATRPSEVSTEMIAASGETAIMVMKELCQQLLNDRGMSDEWKTGVVIPIFEGKGDVTECGRYRGVKLLEHAMKIVERVLDGRIRALVTLDVWFYA